MQITHRPRRNRSSHSVRDLIAQTRLGVEDLIMPLFFCEGTQVKQPITSMPGQFRYSIDNLVDKCRELEDLGVKAVSLFPVIEEKKKTSRALEAINSEGLNPRGIAAVKEACPDLLVMADVALDPYSSDGHDGFVDAQTGEILNDETLEILAQMALVEAQAGADIIGPSDMMDGRVSVIRKTLDSHGSHNTLIMSYTAKYASSFYGPFREALDSAPKAGDKKTYQMDFRNSQEAIRELKLDEREGADIVMVKPGLSYLDIIQRFSENTELPIAAYNVSGEYAMVKAAAEKGWIDGQEVMLEMLTSFKRAGADIILSYFTEEFARLEL
ncbi:MAG: porphobilinogen synthase [Halobacteriovoraceae bacterium]|nr:porphobilinogen synthase [Halobacteriovoraceae bacterium]